MVGYIKLYRSIQEKGWYKKPEYIHLWIHILMKANHTESEFWFNGQNIKLKAGQFVTGRKQLSLETGLSEGMIERALKQFSNEHQIEQQTNSRNRLITIVNYNSYQQTEQPKKKNRTADEQRMNTNNNDNNDNNDNEEELIFSFRKSLLELLIDEKLVDEWLKVRKKKKCVNTETAFETIKREIEKSKLRPNECIRIAVSKSWGGFEAQWLINSKSNQNGTGKKSTDEAIREFLGG